MQKSNSDPIEREINGEPEWTVIWLHGLGADGNDFLPIISELNPNIGANTAQYAKDINPLAFEIIKPQSGVGGLTPKPKNDNELKPSNIHDHLIAPSTIIASLTFGIISFHIIEKLLCPLALADTIKSLAITS